MTEQHFWQGEWIDDPELERRLGGLGEAVEATLREPLHTEILIAALDRLACDLAARGPAYRKLRDYAAEAGVPDEDLAAGVASIGAFCRKPHLMEKLRRELGTIEPFNPTRIDYRRTLFESWAPLGLLVHVAPSNVFAVAALALVEGLLSGNLNLVKTSGSDTLFAQHFADALGACDPTGTVRRYAIVVRLSSRRDDLLQQIFKEADGVSAWGSEEAIAAVRAMAPAGTRFIDWGHKISFAFVAAERLDDGASLEALAHQVCLLEQQACSSPQVLYLETDDRARVLDYADRLARALDRISPTYPAHAPSLQEQAEITSVTELARLAACVGDSRVLAAPDGSWRLLIEFKSGLRASPLYRTIWLKPLLRRDIAATLRPLRKYLQTIGLSCDLARMADLSGAFIRAGALRITRIGQMVGSNYAGEPHDGVYPLQRFTRRVSFDPGETCGRITNFAELAPPVRLPIPAVPVMTKEDFLAFTPRPEDEQLFFSSGGSSGAPKVSIFTYDDYGTQMSRAAEGLFASGLDPARDRCANLFAAGHMYGGFVSFYSILEAMRAPQVPIGMHGDFAEISDQIVRHRVNVLLGFPGWLLQFFEDQKEVLLRYGGIEKIFYGGEHFSEAQKRHLMETFGVKLIRSAVYGSNDAGPLAFPCEHCEGAVFHVNPRLQLLEILDRESDKPVAEGETGRLVFTSVQRTAMPINRYEIGDLGRWVPGPCPCGRTSPRFELQGRCGDVFRPGPCAFLNYNKFVRILSDHLDYSGHVQIAFGFTVGDKSALSVHLDRTARIDAQRAKELMLEHYKDLRWAATEGDALHFEVRLIEPQSFVFVPRSGKIRHLIDRSEAPA